MSTQRKFGDARFRAWWSPMVHQWIVLDRWEDTYLRSGDILRDALLQPVIVKGE